MAFDSHRIVCVTGGRDYSDWVRVFAVLDDLHKISPIWLILNGGATGADELSSQWARSRSIRYTAIHADWDDQGDLAGKIRNEFMVTRFPISLAVIFPGGKGTHDMAERLHREKVERVIVAKQAPGVLKV